MKIKLQFKSWHLLSALTMYGQSNPSLPQTHNTIFTYINMVEKYWKKLRIINFLLGSGIRSVHSKTTKAFFLMNIPFDAHISTVTPFTAPWILYNPIFCTITCSTISYCCNSMVKPSATWSTEHTTWIELEIEATPIYCHRYRLISHCLQKSLLTVGWYIFISCN